MMDAADFMVLGAILLFIGGILLAGLIGWSWERLRPRFQEIASDWHAFRTYRRMERKRAEYLQWKQGR